MSTHAHGISSHDERHDVQMGMSAALGVGDLSLNRGATHHQSLSQQSTAHQHCHEQADEQPTGGSDMRTTDMDIDMAETMEMSEPSMAMPEHSVHAHQATHQSDCCQSLLCKCPCAHAAVMHFSLPYMPALKPSSLTIIADATPMLHAGLPGQFRPPI